MIKTITTMRKHLLFLIFIFCFISAKATLLSGDVIYINGEKWTLFAKPILSDSLLYHRLMDFIPDNRSITTANCEGYTAHWETDGSRLFLQKIELHLLDKDKSEYTSYLNADTLKNVFSKDYGLSDENRIYAGWFSGELRAGQGELIRYTNIGFDRNTEKERIITVCRGQITNISKIFHNYKINGMSITDAGKAMKMKFPFDDFPEYKGQRLIFFLENFKMNDKGKMVDFDVKFATIRPSGEKITDKNHPLIQALKRTMKDIYKWETFYIHDGYTLGYKSFAIPLKEDTCKIIGKVYGEDVRQYPPYDVIRTPLVNAHISIKELPYQGWLTDSTGYFRINRLSNAQFGLQAHFVGLETCDTIVDTRTNIDTLELVLTLPYQYIREYGYSPSLAKEAIRKGHPYIVMVYPEEKINELARNPFWKKYGIGYHCYNTKNGKLTNLLTVPNHILTEYNNEIFKYLDKKYGKEWRKEAPKGIFGLDNSLNYLPNDVIIIGFCSEDKPVFMD